MLNLAENDLSLVESRLLAQTVVVLEEVDLTASNLTVAQVGCIVVVFEEVDDVTAFSST